jgi:ATP phosphoribosyltransferase regulatory subunit
MARWLLPENIADTLPLEARRVEELRRALLDLYDCHGYELVRPPLIEYVDSLLTGTGGDLDLLTFKFTDQASGRLLGLRADMTPQAARIDAHILNRPGVVRLCYAGPVLHARPQHPLASREPQVAGAELFGYAGPQADLELVRLAVQSLRAGGAGRVQIDLGHMGVARALLGAEPAAGERAGAVLAALSAKDASALADAMHGFGVETGAGLRRLLGMYGGREVLSAAARELPALPGVREALDHLVWLAAHCGADELAVDLADLHGYQYLTGVTFSAYVPGATSAVVRGGRYDDVGRAFGRARPAVGFTVYLRELAGRTPLALPRAILAPPGEDPELARLVAQLRAAGEIVVQRLPGESAEGHTESFEFDRRIERGDQGWRIVG